MRKSETVQQEMAKAGPGLIEPDMELFCKAAADGASLGDCPFTHYIQVWRCLPTTHGTSYFDVLRPID